MAERRILLYLHLNFKPPPHASLFSLQHKSCLFLPSYSFEEPIFGENRTTPNMSIATDHHITQRKKAQTHNYHTRTAELNEIDFGNCSLRNDGFTTHTSTHKATHTYILYSLRSTGDIETIYAHALPATKRLSSLLLRTFLLYFLCSGKFTSFLRIIFI